jgi:hypothetical protein
VRVTERLLDLHSTGTRAEEGAKGRTAVDGNLFEQVRRVAGEPSVGAEL